MFDRNDGDRSRLRTLALLALLVALAFGGSALPAQEAEAPAAAPAEEAGQEPQPEPAAAPEAEPEPAAEAEPEPAPEAEMEPVEEPERERRPDRQRRKRRSDAQVVVGSNLTIEEDEISDNVVVVGGNLVILGEVLGDAAAIGGSVQVEGRVTGDVASVGRSVELGPDAEVEGDAMSFGGQVERADGARVRGEIVEVSAPGFRFGLWPRFGSWGGYRYGDDWFHFSPFSWMMEQAWRIFGLVVLVLFACLALLLGRTPVDRIGDRVAAEPWKSLLVGLVSQILFVPLLVLVIVILAVSIIGIPFLFLLPFALVALAIVLFFGYVGVAYRIGEFLAQRFGWQLGSPYVALLLGLGGLHVWSLIGHLINFNGPPLRLFAGLFILFGFVVCYGAFTMACGGAVLTRFATAEGWRRRSLPPAPAAPPAIAATPPAAEEGWAEAEAEPEPAPPAPEEPWEPEIGDEDEADR